MSKLTAFKDELSKSASLKASLLGLAKNRAVIGGVVGAAAGAGIGAARGEEDTRARRAVIGAGLGAITGATLGHLSRPGAVKPYKGVPTATAEDIADRVSELEYDITKQHNTIRKEINTALSGRPMYEGDFKSAVRTKPDIRSRAAAIMKKLKPIKKLS